MSTSRTLVEPYLPEIAVRLFGLEAYGEVAGLIRRGANQYAVVIDLVAEDLFLDSQRHICHLGLEAQFRIGIQSVEFHVIRILDVGISVLRRDGRFDSAGKRCV